LTSVYSKPVKPTQLAFTGFGDSIKSCYYGCIPSPHWDGKGERLKPFSVSDPCISRCS